MSSLTQLLSIEGLLSLFSARTLCFVIYLRIFVSKDDIIYLVMAIQDWAAFVLTCLSIIGLVVGGVRFLVKHYLAELKTNGGSSMRDEIKAIKIRQDEADQMRRDMDKKLDKMYNILIDYIAKSNK